MSRETRVDARGLLCPIPILRLARALSRRPEGTVVLLLATDPAAPGDVAAFCREQGHELIAEILREDVWEFRVRKR